MIVEAKGQRTYDRFSLDCGGVPTSKNLQKLAAREVRAFPDKVTIEGLARGMGVTQAAVLLAFGRSLGLKVAPEDGDVLELPGAGLLRPQARETLLAMSRELQNAYAQPWGDHDHYHLAADEGHADVDPEESEPTT